MKFFFPDSQDQVDPHFDFRTETSLAAERRLLVWPEAELRDDGSWALAQEKLVPKDTRWREVARARGYVLLSR